MLSWVFHVRAVLLLMFLGMVDAVLVHIAYNTTMQSGASVQLVFGFEVKPVTHSSTEIYFFGFLVLQSSYITYDQYCRE